MKKMTIIEIQALPNGAHRNQTVFGEAPLPEGWAVLAEGLEKPPSWPFVDPTVEEVTCYKTVTYLREKVEHREDGEEVRTLEEVTEEVPYTVLTVTAMTEREKPAKEEAEAPIPTGTSTVWDELDAAYQEGVNKAYEQ